MTDETTARDRAIEDLADRVWRESHVSSRPGQGESLEQIAVELRALAGAPTADVAAGRELARLRAAARILREREAELLEVKGPCRTPGCELHRAHRGPCDIAAPAVEPEGMDVEAQGETAAELTATERLAGWVNGGQYDAAKLRADVREVLRALTGFRSSTHAVGLALGLAPLGGAPIDGEAVLGRAREVAAELVASRRVRELHQGAHECPSGDDGCGWWPDGDCPTVRALDGDTTEEQR